MEKGTISMLMKLQTQIKHHKINYFNSILLEEAKSAQKVNFYVFYISF